MIYFLYLQMQDMFEVVRILHESLVLVSFYHPKGVLIQRHMHTHVQACIPSVRLLFPRRSRVLSVCIQLLEPPPPTTPTSTTHGHQILRLGLSNLFLVGIEMENWQGWRWG